MLSSGANPKTVRAVCGDQFFGVFDSVQEVNFNAAEPGDRVIMAVVAIKTGDDGDRLRIRSRWIKYQPGETVDDDESGSESEDAEDPEPATVEEEKPPAPATVEEEKPKTPTPVTVEEEEKPKIPTPVKVEEEKKTTKKPPTPTPVKAEEEKNTQVENNVSPAQSRLKETITATPEVVIEN